MMLTQCKYCLCTGASYEQYMFGYQSAETKHKRIKKIIDICLFNIIKIITLIGRKIRRKFKCLN